MTRLISRPKRRKGNKISPKIHDRSDYCGIVDGIVRVGCTRRGKLAGVHHDNGKTRIGTGGGGNRWVARVPSLRRSNKIWKNFYKLFPSVYFNMREAATGGNVQEGGYIIYTGGSSVSSRHVKLRVVDMTGEFKKVGRTLVEREHLYFGMDSTILENKQAEIYIKTI